jgi:predicted ribosomally synthesized peptide with SipW-like signal peptide
MRTILFSLMVIGIASTLLGTGTLSYFSDTEISYDNSFTAGTIDMLIDCHSTHYQFWPGEGNVLVEEPIIFGEKDLVQGDRIFNWHDIKPGDFGEATISIHVYDNDAWGWMRVTNAMETGGILSEPEFNELGVGETDDGELSQNMMIMIWVDEGAHDGFGNDPVEWNCDEKCPTCDCDGGEGDNIWQDDYEPVIFEGTMYDFIYGDPILFTQNVMEACVTYYIGWAWSIPVEVGNIIQGDTLVFDIEFYAEQYRNNPNPVDPWD